MPEEKVRLSREQLYDLVWAKPMTTIAAEFGITTAAMKAHCERVHVPTPWSGYWVQLAAGKTVQRSLLPNAGPTTPSEIVIDGTERGRPSPASLPTVTVAKTLSNVHPTVRVLQKKLAESGYSIRGVGHAVVRVGPKAEKRVWLLLDALFKALADRGHDVQFGSGSGRDSFALKVLVRREHPAEFWLNEHVSGRFIIETDLPWGVELRRRWADGKHQRLEHILGEVVVGLEAVAEAWRADRERRELERQEQQRQLEERRAVERRAADQKALHDDLVKMANDWRQAETVRAFLTALSARVPEEDRSGAFDIWLAWATKHAEALDPLREPARVAKALEP